MVPMLSLTSRELKEIHHSLLYAKNFAHGTVGHNAFMLIAALALHSGFNLDSNDKLLVPENVRVDGEGR